MQHESDRMLDIHWRNTLWNVNIGTSLLKRHLEIFVFETYFWNVKNNKNKKIQDEKGSHSKLLNTLIAHHIFLKLDFASGLSKGQIITWDLPSTLTYPPMTSMQGAHRVWVMSMYLNLGFGPSTVVESTTWGGWIQTKCTTFSTKQTFSSQSAEGRLTAILPDPNTATAV